MTEIVEALGWQLEVDRDMTRKLHDARRHGAAESCGCLPCRNFVAARAGAYPAELLALLARLGIPHDRDSEIYHLGRVQDGQHLYGGWFHFVGRVIEGPGAGEHATESGRIELADLCDGFSVGFNSKSSLVPNTFPRDRVAQLEFCATLPWVLTVRALE